MKIALDHDGTYTRDPEFWDKFIALVKEAGHEVAVVTCRYETEPIDGLDIPIYYMDRNAKMFCSFRPDIWIDNEPLSITQGYAF